MTKLCRLSKSTPSDIRLYLASPIKQKYVLLTSPRDSQITEFKTLRQISKKKMHLSVFILFMLTKII